MPNEIPNSRDSLLSKYRSAPERESSANGSITASTAAPTLPPESALSQALKPRVAFYGNKTDKSSVATSDVTEKCPLCNGPTTPARLGGATNWRVSHCANCTASFPLEGCTSDGVDASDSY